MARLRGTIGVAVLSALIGAGVTAFVMEGFGDDDEPDALPTTTTIHRSVPTAAIGEWYGPDGSRLSEFSASSHLVPPHCYGDSQAIHLLLAWPPGTTPSTAPLVGEVRTYARPWPNPYTDDWRFLPEVAMPSGARPTGLHRPGAEIWVDPRDSDSFIYVKLKARVERWNKLADGPVGCM
jgi:hypothetical protein